MDRLKPNSSSGLYFGAAVPLAGQREGIGRAESWRVAEAEAAIWSQGKHALRSGTVEAAVGILEADMVR